MDNSFDSLLNASAVPQDEKVQAFIAESKNNRNRCYELSEQVTAQVATDGKMLQKYLDVQSTFDRYTTNNALLILAQRPDAQKLGDYGYWRDHGFYLKRMERQNPVLILEPGKHISVKMVQLEIIIMRKSYMIFLRQQCPILQFKSQNIKNMI